MIYLTRVDNDNQEYELLVNRAHIVSAEARAGGLTQLALTVGCYAVRESLYQIATASGATREPATLGDLVSLGRLDR